MPDRPNVVVILSDQQRWDTLACYGNDWIQTPRLNRLAEQSAVFEAAYVTQPVCVPARASIMTGLYPHSAGPVVNKMNLDPSIPVLPEMISDDYTCGYFGKWHLGDDIIRQHGYHEWVSSEDGHRAQYTRREHLRVMSDYWHYLREQGYEPQTEAYGAMIFDAWERALMPEEHQMASFLGRRAADFIRRNAGAPFVMYVSTFEPHPPYYGPLNDLYDPAQIPTGPAFLQRPEGHSLVNRVRADYYTNWLGSEAAPPPGEYVTSSAAAALGNDVTTEHGWRTLRARYMANITLADSMVGMISDALDEVGVADNTAVVFSSEHGDMAGDHRMLEKRTFYEEASRVPLLMRVPWLSQSARKIEGSAGHIDLIPTLLDLMGESPPAHLQGKSLAPVLSGDADLSDNEVFIQWNGLSPDMEDRALGWPQINRMLNNSWRSVVVDRWKLNLCAADQCELFDLRSDPHETRNLFDDPAQRDRVRDMTARIRAWQVRMGDTAPLPSV